MSHLHIAKSYHVVKQVCQHFQSPTFHHLNEVEGFYITLIGNLAHGLQYIAQNSFTI